MVKVRFLQDYGHYASGSEHWLGKKKAFTLAAEHIVKILQEDNSKTYKNRKMSSEG